MSFKHVELSRGLTAKVDAEDFERISDKKWFAQSVAGGRFYAASKRHTDTGRRIIYLHREVTGAGNEIIRFKNGDTLDCRKDNLITQPISSNRRTIEQGIQAELAVCADLIRHGHEVYLPFSGHSPADLVSCKGSFPAIRWQVKSRSLMNNGTSIYLATSGIHSRKGGNVRIPIDLSRIDGFAIYCPQTEQVYYLPVKDIDPTMKSVTINIGPNQSKLGRRAGLALTNPDRILVTSTVTK